MWDAFRLQLSRISRFCPSVCVFHSSCTETPLRSRTMAISSLSIRWSHSLQSIWNLEYTWRKKSNIKMWIIVEECRRILSPTFSRLVQQRFCMLPSRRKEVYWSYRHKLPRLLGLVQKWKNKRDAKICATRSWWRRVLDNSFDSGLISWVPETWILVYDLCRGLNCLCGYVLASKQKRTPDRLGQLFQCGDARISIWNGNSEGMHPRLQWSCRWARTFYTSLVLL